MRNFVFGLIMMLFAFSALPVQAHAPDDGVKKEIVKAPDFTFVNAVGISIEVPQVLFQDYSNYRPAELWNYSFKNSSTSVNIFNFH